MSNPDELLAQAAMAIGHPLNFKMYPSGPVGAFTMDEFIAILKAVQKAERDACERVARDDSLVLRDGYHSEDRTACNIANTIKARTAP